MNNFVYLFNKGMPPRNKGAVFWETCHFYRRGTPVRAPSPVAYMKKTSFFWHKERLSRPLKQEIQFIC